MSDTVLLGSDAGMYSHSAARGAKTMMLVCVQKMSQTACRARSTFGGPIVAYCFPRRAYQTRILRRVHILAYMKLAWVLKGSLFEPEVQQHGWKEWLEGMVPCKHGIRELEESQPALHRSHCAEMPVLTEPAPQAPQSEYMSCQ